MSLTGLLRTVNEMICDSAQRKLSQEGNIET